MTQNIDWQSQGYKIFQAANGAEALDVLQREQIHILVTDIQMPKLTGIELVQRAREFLPQLVVILVSGYGDYEYSSILHTLDVQDYLLKPFRSQRLLDTVNRTRASFEKERGTRGCSDDLALTNCGRREVFTGKSDPEH